MWPNTPRRSRSSPASVRSSSPSPITTRWKQWSRRSRGSTATSRTDQQRFRSALASLELEAPQGDIRLDENRRAVGRTTSEGREGPERSARRNHLSFRSECRADVRRLLQAGRADAEQATSGLPEGQPAAAGHADQPALSDQVKRVRFSGGARPPGRRPLRTSSVGCPLAASALRAGPSPSFLPAVGQADDGDRRFARRSGERLGRQARRAAARPRRRGHAERRATRSPAAGSSHDRPSAAGPAIRSGTSASSRRARRRARSRVQSCSAPANGTSTGPGRRPRRRRLTATSQGAARRSSRRSASSRNPGVAATRTRSTSCSVASRAVSAPGDALVKTADRASHPAPRSPRTSAISAVALRGRPGVRRERHDDHLPRAASARAAQRSRAAAPSAVAPSPDEDRPPRCLPGVNLE